MRPRPVGISRLARLAALLSVICLSPAQAQVTVNPGALDLLPPAPNHPARSAPAPRRPHPAPAPAPHAEASKPTSAPAAPPAPTPATPPPLPTVPPAIAALPPPAPIPPPRPQPAPVVPLAADAPGAATPIPDGARITFGPGRFELNPATEAAIRALARPLQANADATIALYAYATATPDDPSTGRRLALGRALAARAVLIEAGIASTRIYPRSMPLPGGPDGPDRVDAIVTLPKTEQKPGITAAAEPAK